MPGKRIITHPSDVVYLYDGTLDGFFCCVYESVYGRQMPQEIVPEQEQEPSLLEDLLIVTDAQKAARVRKSIRQKISREALNIVECVFLSCLEQKEIYLLKFLLKGYECGAAVLKMMGDADVSVILKAKQHFFGEVHQMMQFIRFADYDGFLVATITPKNFVLPYLVQHFTDRYYGESFLIYDNAHGAALFYKEQAWEIIPLESLELAEESEEELEYQALWKRFYHTIAIKERENFRLRMSHMPKRYWQNMTEMKELL